MQPKYIFISGGVISSLGKGIAASSLGMLLEHKNLNVTMMKLEPYLNVDPGTMSPYQHGEVYVTDDGAETDLDLGHYYRFTNSPLSHKSATSSGQVYTEVLKKERKGDFLGKTVQVIPHITDEIKRRILACAHQNPNTDVVIIEVGGTVGDIESLPFLEAIRQFRYERFKDCINIHVTFIPYLKSAGETKTKPTQHSTQALRALGITPDIILCRCETSLHSEEKEKISLFCNVKLENVIEAVDCKTTIYELPLQLHEQGIDDRICELLDLKAKKGDLTAWYALVDAIKDPKGTINIGLVGKYVEHQDAYKSIIESLHHAASFHGYRINIHKFDSDKFESNQHIPESMQNLDGYLIPGGFGDRGWEGKILTVKYCRTNKIPYFGICLGMQALVCEYARNVLKLPTANSTEMDPDTKDPVIDILEEQKTVAELGGTMRLGAYPCSIKENTLAYKAYGKPQVSERHRHRYEVNSKYVDSLEKNGLNISGKYKKGDLTEIVEIKDHPWMVGVQFHPEFCSKPTSPHPLFRDFLEAAIIKQRLKNS